MTAERGHHRSWTLANGRILISYAGATRWTAHLEEMERAVAILQRWHRGVYHIWDGQRLITNPDPAPGHPSWAFIGLDSAIKAFAEFTTAALADRDRRVELLSRRWLRVQAIGLLIGEEAYAEREQVRRIQCAIERRVRPIHRGACDRLLQMAEGDFT